MSIVDAKKAVFFDLFATLVSTDSAPGVPTYEILGVAKAAWRQQTFSATHSRLTRNDLQAEEIIRSMAHSIDPGISDSLIQEATDQRIARFDEMLRSAPEATLSVLETLKSRGVTTALISNADVIETSGWNRSPMARLFDHAVFSCHVGFAKPDRRIYEHCLGLTGLTSNDAVFVGDGGSQELVGARAVGLTVVFSKGMMPELTEEEVAQRERAAHHVINSLPELLGRE